MSKSLDIVVHCWAADLPHYAAMLREQIRSLFQHKPADCDVQLIVGCANEDANTREMLYQFTAGQTGATTAFDSGPAVCHHYYLHGITLCEVVMPKGELFRRAILRHKWTQRSEADVLWFADCDYTVGEGTLAAICARVQRTDGLCFPREYYIHNDHATGDRAVASGKIDLSEFRQTRAKRAIGGIQIIGAEVAKKIGYLGHGRRKSKWQEPEDPSVPFRCFRDDSTWRRLMFPDGGREIEVPNLFRLRHSIGAEGSKGPGNKVQP